MTAYYLVKYFLEKVKEKKNLMQETMICVKAFAENLEVNRSI